MAKKTIAQLEATLAALEAGYQGKCDELETLQRNLKRDFVPMAEYRRVQGVLRTTQSFYARLKQSAAPASSNFKQRCQAYFAATGHRSVTSTELRAWEQSHA